MPARCHRLGLTLVELLAATVLSTLLMAAVLGLLTSVSKAQSVALRAHGIPDPWQQRLDEVLRWDLQNSRSIRTTEAGIELAGFAGRDLSTRMPIHCPCLVEYFIVATGDRTHLFRRESHVESLNIDNSYSDLVCLDVSKITIGPASDRTNASVRDQALPALPNGPLPSEVNVSLTSTGAAFSSFSKTFSLR
ncbi:hypothetical protein [Schlesneria paludicola]|uniref:hypothetical protein n=1 Tax=Schlesneria paludicola TaxID=360056 RepID=UPI00029A27BD|nr:hypothetical protein [Schlesneria paludicola]